MAEPSEEVTRIEIESLKIQVRNKNCRTTALYKKKIEKILLLFKIMTQDLIRVLRFFIVLYKPVK